MVVLFGCDGVFKLTEVPPPTMGADAANVDTVSACRYATIAADEPGQDEDGDSTINSLDACPTVPYASTHDEDMDGVFDDCDPCPTIVASGDDSECDLVGAACDPDDGAAHVQKLFGFGDAGGLQVYKVAITEDQAQGPSGATSGDISTLTAVTPVGRFEIRGRVHQIDADYRSIGIDFDEEGSGAHYEIDLGIDQLYWIFSISKDDVVVSDPITGPAKSEHGAPGLTDVAFRIVVDYDGTTLTATLSGDLTASVSATVSLGNVRYGAGFYNDAPTSVIEVDWLRRVAPQ